jgi:Fe-S-cluster containining protein
MRFFHPEYETFLKTNDLTAYKAYGDLNRLYKKIPNVVCVKCPKKKKIEADCCKSFSPPMLLVEFLHILDQIETTMNKEKKIELILKCIKTVLNTDISKECVLLNKNNQCSCYDRRPMNCRMFGVYTKEEWSDRLEKLKETFDCDIKDIPFYRQCKNVKIKGKKKKISRLESDMIFHDIYDIDMNFFENKKQGREIVFDSKTYLPFHIHYLLINMGPDLLDNLVIMREGISASHEKFKNGEIDEETLKNSESQIESFIEIMGDNLKKDLQETGG